MDLRKRIDEKGLKHVWVAKQLGVSKGYLSMVLSGERSLSEEKEKILDSIL